MRVCVCVCYIFVSPKTVFFFVFCKLTIHIKLTAHHMNNSMWIKTELSFLLLSVCLSLCIKIKILLMTYFAALKRSLCVADLLHSSLMIVAHFDITSKKYYTLQITQQQSLHTVTCMSLHTCIISWLMFLPPFPTVAAAVAAVARRTIQISKCTTVCHTLNT